MAAPIASSTLSEEILKRFRERAPDQENRFFLAIAVPRESPHPMAEL